MTGDFNIRDHLCDSSFLHHSFISEDLLIIADLFDLELSTPTNPIPIRYSDTIGKSNSVIDLIFLCSGSRELNKHIIHPDWHLLSDHAPLTITIPITEEFIHSSKLKIPKNSKEEEIFVKEIINIFKALNTLSITNHELLEYTVNSLATRIEQAWLSNAKNINITKHSKKWWNDNCNRSLSKYREFRNLEDWKLFKHMVKTTKRMFFDSKIQKIANKSHGPWELMNWVNKKKLPVIETIKHNDLPYLLLYSLWTILHSSFNSALDCQVDINVLNEIGDKPIASWPPFSKEEFKIAISSYNNSSAPESDNLSWNHLKSILKYDKCLINIIGIANTYIDLEYWPNHFKKSTMIIIPKPNKLSYDSPKSFRPIVLLNTLGKLIKKVIRERIQFHIASNDFIHLSQLGGLKFKSTTDTGVILTHIIRSGWQKNLLTSTLVFDISQFFPSLNHCLLTKIIQKVGSTFVLLTFSTIISLTEKPTTYGTTFLHIFLM